MRLLAPTWTFCILIYGVLGHTKYRPRGRIVGGRNTTIEQHPYQLSFGVYGSHRCGAALIKPNVAITAAHCTISAPVNGLTIRAGTTLNEKGGTVVEVSKVCQHPKFELLDYDISLLLLNESLQLGDSIQVVPMQPMGEEVPVGTLASVTGWGRVFMNGPMPPLLQVVNVPKISQKDCVTSYPDEKITSRMTCYGYIQGGKDACQGDSGGPLVVDRKLTGLVSWGYGCAQPRIPGVYTNLADEDIINHINFCLDNFSRFQTNNN